MTKLNSAQQFYAKMIQLIFGDYPIPANDLDFLEWAGNLSDQMGGQWVRDNAYWLINWWEQVERERYCQKKERGEPISYEKQRLTAEQFYKELGIDMRDLGTEVHLTANLPGAKKDDIDVELMPRSIEIKAEVSAEVEREPLPNTWHERGYTYKRKLDLPEDIIPDKAEARFNNGVLKVVMPKSRPSKA